MLILSRKKDSSIILKLPNGETVEVKVVSLKGGTCKIGVEASESIKVWREELFS